VLDGVVRVAVARVAASAPVDGHDREGALEQRPQLIEAPAPEPAP
jgi:hypothetical protein